MKKKLILLLLLAGGSISNLDAMEEEEKPKGRSIRIVHWAPKHFGNGIDPVFMEINEETTAGDVGTAFAEKMTNLQPGEKFTVLHNGRRLDASTKLTEKLDFAQHGWWNVQVIWDKSYNPPPPASRPTPSPTVSLEPPAPVGPRPRTITGKRVGGAVITIAALTAAVAGLMKIRAYRNTKRKLIKNYKLRRLSTLQNKTWLATVLASNRIPWYLLRLVRTNKGSLAEFVGSDPRALAELYYRHEPTPEEVNTFLARFFGEKVNL